MDKKKKSFNISPAMKFITTPGELTAQAENPNPVKRERKTRRLQLLITPSLYANLNHMKDVWDVSMNELINSILEEYARERHP
jgi:hypothetical protein